MTGRSFRLRSGRHAYLLEDEKMNRNTLTEKLRATVALLALLLLANRAAAQEFSHGLRR